MNDNNKKDWWEKVGDNMSRRWLSRFETTASRHLGRMPFFVSALDKDKGKQPPTLSLFSTFLLYLSFIISFLSPASMRNHIFPFLSPNAFPPILHCSTTFFHLPQCLSSVFVILFFFFFWWIIITPYPSFPFLLTFCLPLLSLSPPSSLFDEENERKERDCTLMWKMPNVWVTHTLWAYHCVCACVTDSVTVGNLNEGVEVVLLNFQMHTVLCESSVDHSFWEMPHKNCKD